MRWIIRIVVTLVTLAVVVVAGLLLIPSERIARIAEAEFEKNTGRKLTISGGVQPKLFPRLGVSLAGAAISNADWSDQGPLLTAKSLDVGVTLGALLGGDVVVEAFTIDEPVIRLERSEDGQVNWQFLSDLSSGEDAGASDLDKFSLPKASISNGTLSFVDRQAGATYALNDVNATLSAADFDALAELFLEAKLQGQPFSVTAGLDGLEALLNGDLRPVSLAFATGGTRVDFQGQAGMDPVQAKGMLNVDIADQPALFALLGTQPPLIPPGLGQKPKLSGELTLTPDNTVYLRNAVIDLDQNRFEGDLDLALAGEKPVVTARLRGGAIDFSAMSTDETEGDGAANADAGGWSEAYLDVSGLSAVDGGFSVAVEALDLGSVKLGPTDLNGTIEESRLVLDLRRVSVFDGLVTGQFVVNGRSGLSVGGDLDASSVAMQRLLQDFAGYDRLVGQAEMSLKFLASGTSMNALMNSLSGTGALSIGAGELLGLDIAGMIKNLDTSFRGEGSKTIFDSITASFDIANGVLQNDDLNFEADLLTAKGAGQLGIGAQTISYRLDPTALANQLSSGIRVPVLIEGPWSDIRFRPDLKGLVDTRLEDEKAKLKEQAKAKEDELKAKAEAKIAEKLNIAPAEEGQSLEDQLKEKAKSKLRGLLGGN